jgi:MoaA/NifB/PqqE/SkfB family radical SAM enzyme
MLIPFKSALKSLAIINIKLTAKRIINLMKITSSMLLSRITGMQIVWGYPIILMVEPTNICNLKCPMCPSGNGDMKRALGELDLENYKKLIDDIGDYILQIQLWNQGEPFINRSFLDFIRYAKEKGIMVQTSTNGHFIRTDKQAEDLIQSGLDHLIFSMDGTNPKTYEKYRVGGNYNLVIETLGRIARIRDKLHSKTPLLELQFIVFRHNQNEIDEIIALSKKNKINHLSFKTAQVYSSEQAEMYLPQESSYSRYKFDGKTYEMKGEIKNWCKRLWLNSTVNWDGSVSPCCFDKDAEHAFANIFGENNSFKTTWKNIAYMRFRKRVMTKRKAIFMCNNCTEGLPEPYIKIIEISDL